MPGTAVVATFSARRAWPRIDAVEDDVAVVAAVSEPAVTNDTWPSDGATLYVTVMPGALLPAASLTVVVRTF